MRAFLLISILTFSVQLSLSQNLGKVPQTKSGHIQKRVKPIDYSFSFRYYQLYEDKNDFDSVRLWTEAKLKKTFENKGTIHHNFSKAYLKWKLYGSKEEEVHHIFHAEGNYVETVEGLKYYRFNDPVYGPSVAVYQKGKNKWIVYRADPPVKIVSLKN
ncbi:MAG TPA: hypothetical protein VGQ59_07410 [Cyclobacteriaceae bacterium]|jgi:hypothetical protein|nr:hypothetical protein [Cyclobacteriaceae bacterium]